jgi:hypothetical protein
MCDGMQFVLQGFELCVVQAGCGQLPLEGPSASCLCCAAPQAQQLAQVQSQLEAARKEVVQLQASLSTAVKQRNDACRHLIAERVQASSQKGQVARIADALREQIQVGACCGHGALWEAGCIGGKPLVLSASRSIRLLVSGWGIRHQTCRNKGIIPSGCMHFWLLDYHARLQELREALVVGMHVDVMLHVECM